MSFWDSLMALFGGKKQQAAPAAMQQQRSRTGMGNNSTMSRPKNKQVYEGRQTPPPEWAADKSVSDLLAELPKHIVCKYMPKFEMKRIMSTQIGPDGNLLPEYDGVAGDCGALKQFGRKVAEQNGMTMPYRYVDLNIAYRACCDNPQKCPFFLNAEGDMQAVNSRRR
ncbi:MAG: hypothetical protein J5746_13850 [Victivallales bacterium]|nr:hypothetical protein [Victivallales bacterium]